MSDPPRPGIEPMASALAGDFFTTEPPRKSCWNIFGDISEFPFQGSYIPRPKQTWRDPDVQAIFLVDWDSCYPIPDL